MANKDITLIFLVSISQTLDIVTFKCSTASNSSMVFQENNFVPATKLYNKKHQDSAWVK